MGVLTRGKNWQRSKSICSFTIWNLKNLQESPPSGLNVYDQQTKRVHDIKTFSFAITADQDQIQDSVVGGTNRRPPDS